MEIEVMDEKNYVLLDILICRMLIVKVRNEI